MLVVFIIICYFLFSNIYYRYICSFIIGAETKVVKKFRYGKLDLFEKIIYSFIGTTEFLALITWKIVKLFYNEKKNE